ncbi:DUF6644 family protein [Chroococcidiopsis sp.]|uniref:DUF6644 family protein n=1 Tax=Chroococcidiopsis sp. TaxID=3088168 RepID=UPI003F674BCC
MDVPVESMNILEWLEYSAIGETARQFYPWLEVMHILGFSMLIGCITIFDLRLLGYYRRLSIADGVLYLLRLARMSFIVAAVSGFFLFAAQATLLVVNPAFRLKLLLLAIALLNAVIFHWKFSPPRQVKQLIFVKAIAIISLLAWMGIVICGRFIAYT